MAKQPLLSIRLNEDKIKSILDNLKQTQEMFDDMSKVLSEMIAKAFVARARKVLLYYTHEKRYSYYIKAVKGDEGHWSVVLNHPKYDPYIMYFLEYGTGFAGEESEQNPEKPADWQFAINYGDPRAFWFKAVDIGGGQQEGWYFKYLPNHYIGDEDIDKGINTKGNQIYFTRGIKPVMYIYKTKIKIQQLLDQVYGKKLKISYKLLKKRLNAMINESIED